MWNHQRGACKLRSYHSKGPSCSVSLLKTGLHYTLEDLSLAQETGNLIMVWWANRASWILHSFCRFHGNRKCKTAVLIILNACCRKEEKKEKQCCDVTVFEFGPGVGIRKGIKSLRFKTLAIWDYPYQWWEWNIHSFSSRFITGRVSVALARDERRKEKASQPAH